MTNIVDSLKAEISSLQNKRAALVSDIDKDIETLQNALAYYQKGSKVYASAVIPLPIKVQLHTTLKETVLNVVLKEIEKFESTEYIYQTLLQRYFPEKTGAEASSFKIQVSSLLSSWKAGGQIVSYQYTTSKRDNVWGRKEWLDETGKPKTGYFKNPRFEVIEKNSPELTGLQS